MQLHANPSNGRRLHSLPLRFFLATYSLFPSRCSRSFLAPLSTFGYLSLFRSLCLRLTLGCFSSFSSSLRNPARLITPPFSLHPRSMTSARGNAPQRRLLSFPRSIPFARVSTLRPSPRVHPAPVPLSFILSFSFFLPRRCSLFTSVRDF